MSNVIALDFGSRRVGIAIGSTDTKLVRETSIIENNRELLPKLKELTAREQAAALVIGLPRSLDGHETAQSLAVRRFGGKCQDFTGVEVRYQDESGTSEVAQQRLGKSAKVLDAESARIILEDYLGSL